MESSSDLQSKCMCASISINRMAMTLNTVQGVMVYAFTDRVRLGVIYKLSNGCVFYFLFIYLFFVNFFI